MALVLLGLVVAGCSDSGSPPGGPGDSGVPGGTTPPSVTYVALGDSIASGHGLGAPGTGHPDDAGCQRSTGATADTSAYTDLVRAELKRRFPGGVSGSKLACGGATSEQMRDSQVPAANTEMGDDTAVATVTIGANDFRFTDPATYAKALSPDDGVLAGWRDPIENTLRRNLAQSLLSLGSGHPRRKLVVTHYYDPFNAESVVYSLAPSCRRPVPAEIGASPDPRTVDCRRRTAEIVAGLNQAIDGAVDDYREAGGDGSAEVAVVDRVTEAFTGHEGPRPNCGTALPDAADAWVQAPPRALVTELLTRSTALESGQDCFHLNAEGHRQLARLVVEKLPSPAP